MVIGVGYLTVFFLGLWVSRHGQPTRFSSLSWSGPALQHCSVYLIQCSRQQEAGPVSFHALRSSLAIVTSSGPIFLPVAVVKRWVEGRHFVLYPWHNKADEKGWVTPPALMQPHSLLTCAPSQQPAHLFPNPGKIQGTLLSWPTDQLSHRFWGVEDEKVITPSPTPPYVRWRAGRNFLCVFSCQITQTSINRSSPEHCRKWGEESVRPFLWPKNQIFQTTVGSKGLLVYFS